MSHFQTDDLRIKAITEVSAPEKLHEKYPISDLAAQTVYNTREAIKNILHDKDDRMLVVIGPCSIHDPKAARDYATRLKTLIEKYADDLLIVMRVYFEKPRTTVGWKGLINDPNLDESFEINKGLELARSLLLDINSEGVPSATEFLDLISPQYVADLISWGAIGARTTESQGHRELASGISCPIGFKNGTDGGFKIAVDAIRAANNPHIFLSLTKQGHSAIFSTTGNPDCHVILRGGNDGPNYDAPHVAEAVKALEEAHVQTKLMVDCSHANSNKEHKNQLVVAKSIRDQLTSGEPHIMGAMIESHITEGRQDVVEGQPLTYGQSITDACIGWDDSITALELLAEGVRNRRKVAK
ncbi:3-deoxy-7-phosphoheptulonate synthase [Hydrogenovibrio marinus]|uniref:Phospho-2-dehydro-3-deoxyheptonate aldolase n=1 Tax=Hydrogenovibrio marinus TaxID=28885 RepID=A0A066ZNH8_HYDMR|nr:3-deoxy-7-phosphoheptulonate synthase [Hydrogenovibrio marinus]KDN95368.1 phospho-2-dehydro-3-deoxyheptonate aldolase [Hydrogenovibrio marinus]BBN59855.1 phospho-2-dehydro-3-deoxyheptonate aldolase [Hydrogenovibrio marinus]